MKLSRLLYKQECIGYQGKPFIAYKIRTMKTNANCDLDEILNGELDQFGRPVNDSRVTTLGKILRKYWIDELPQLYNLLKGEVKIVGVRPKPKKWWDLYPDNIQKETLQQKPGLFAIQYAFLSDCLNKGDFEINIKNIRLYLEDYRKNPFLTDLRYLSRIFRNILFYGVRSS